MFARIYTSARVGFHATLISAEADLLPGLPNVSVIGLPDHSLRESRDRIRSAVHNSGFRFPVRNIVINLAPNDTPKEGGLIEAAMAVAVLVSSGQLPQEAFAGTAILGALSLDGSLVAARGIIASALFAAGSKQITRLIVPEAVAGSLTVPPETEVYAIRTLGELPLYCSGGMTPRAGLKYEPAYEHPEICVEHIFGLGPAKRALAIAAVGRHHVLMAGSPGTGKSLLARAYRHILPPLPFHEAAEVTRIWSLAGLTQGDLVTTRPFRSPHHTTSTPALVGGSSNATPGEISFAHHGTLFLDELPEFRNEALQSLREPLEEHKITVSRARGHITYPADFQLIAAANPCRCGLLFSEAERCTCPKRTSFAQFNKIVGPFLDRVAIELNLNVLPETDTEGAALTTQNLRSRIAAAQARSRAENLGNLNRDADAQNLYRQFSVLKPHRLYESVAASERLSMRSWLNVLRVAKSIADFEDMPPGEQHLYEALRYRFVRKWMARAA